MLTDVFGAGTGWQLCARLVGVFPFEFYLVKKSDAFVWGYFRPVGSSAIPTLYYIQPIPTGLHFPWGVNVFPD